MLPSCIIPHGKLSLQDPRTPKDKQNSFHNTGCPKKVTFRMLLEPQFIRSITSSRHPSQSDLDQPLSENDFFWWFLTKTKTDQALSSHIHGKIWPCSTQFWLGFLGFSSILKVTFLGHPVTTASQYNAIVWFNSSKEISLPKVCFIFPAKVLCNGAVQLVLGFCRVTRPSLGQRLVFPGSSVATALRAYLISGQ